MDPEPSDEIGCPLCGRVKHFANPRKRKRIYGHEVCKKCCYAFANRRQLAFIIDVVLLQFAAWIGTGVYAAIFLVGTPVEELGWLAVSGVLIIGYGTPFLIVLRDAFRGRSIGKIICGVETVDEGTGAPCGFRGSILRGLPILVPIVPLIIGYQLMKGHRWGDRWARTRVRWRRHAGSPVFSSRAELDRVFE